MPKTHRMWCSFCQVSLDIVEHSKAYRPEHIYLIFLVLHVRKHLCNSSGDEQYNFLKKWEEIDVQLLKQFLSKYNPYIIKIDSAKEHRQYGLRENKSILQNLCTSFKWRLDTKELGTLFKNFKSVLDPMPPDIMRGEITKSLLKTSYTKQ